MKIIDPSYEIFTDISENGEKELAAIERIARTCYKSEDKITGPESAKKLISMLIAKGHEAMLEHSSLSVKFICDRGVSHELVRHRMASFAQESTRYCNYSKGKFEGITFVLPIIFKGFDPCALYNAVSDNDDIYPESFNLAEKACVQWFKACLESEACYLSMVNQVDVSPQMARSVLPNSLKTEVVITANYREWRHILDLRCGSAAHPQMRELMLPLLRDLHERIPVIFDDLYEKYKDYLQ